MNSAYFLYKIGELFKSLNYLYKKNNIMNNTERKELAKKTFEEKARNIHGNKYDYSQVKYVNAHTKVCIICPEHGEFWQTPNGHLNGYGCDKCGGTYSYTSDEFIEKAREVHGDKYDYSNINYISANQKVCIICPEHGEFWQTPNSHLNGHGCPQCSNVKLHNHFNKGKDVFIEEAQEVHGNKYDYSKVDYINNKTKVCIICPEHGEFWKTPYKHICCKEGCQKCSGRYKLTTDEFIEKAREVHGDKYDYSKVKYINNKTKVCIICPKHGEFWQTPYKHLFEKTGCPICNLSHLENEMKSFLESKNIRFVMQHKFDWLKKQSLDFYLPEYKTAIECQGIQHFKSNDWYNESIVKEVKERDNRKADLCKENKIKIYYYSDLGIEYPYKVYEDKETMINDIINNK